ncbi:MAG: ABC transporter substrate-binding protein [Deltaproteobacteria bacterium]|nr:ABC transporter substrate-binding protein [Deltaproteobacteria bacterium]PNV82026.1 MAG: branched-chain amino acid ABC transporter substrate-binding protein [Desulfobacteraceae bacterium]MDH3896516.1 ABC transporter substrate-binding protein [Deltaproteobacteria bacterium]MDH3927095.1 ABC transporter substrate-binding protein [Deltaproteobacteria bacterium]MDH3951705.1 ABC transporter substrate-binding protein [Deltaproteobacteria bacterium]
MKIKGRAIWIALILIVSLALVFSCTKEKEPYKVGAVFSVTGRTSFLGEPEKKTAVMIAEAINKVGGINGHPLELVVYDDESDETKCVLAVKRLLKKDKVPVIIGPSLSGNTLAVVKVMNDAKVPLVSCAASNKIVTPVVDRKWVFKVPQSDTHAVEKIYDYLLKNGIKKIAIMSVSTGFGASGREELLRLAPEVGIEILADERYGPKDTDITAQLTRIRGTDAQAIVNWSVGPTQVLAVKNWHDLGMTNMPFYQSHGFGSRQNIELAAGAAEGVFCPLGRVNIPDLVPADHPQKKVIEIYNKAYQAKYNEPLSSFGGHGWDALNLVIDALKAVGPDSAKIRDYIETRTNFIGQHGVFNFSPTDHNGLTKEAFEMVVVKDGDWALAP